MLENLLQQLEDEDPDTREIAAQELVSLNDPDSIEPLMELLSHNNSRVRATAVYVLGELREIIGTDLLVDVLLPLLEDEDLFVQVQAVTVLGLLDDMRSFDPIFDFLFDEDLYRDPENLLGNTALTTLNNLSRDFLEERLISKLQETEDFDDDFDDEEELPQDLRAIAVYWLGKIKSYEAVPHLTELLEEQDLEVRVSVVNALAEIAHEQAVPALISALETSLTESNDFDKPVYSDDSNEEQELEDTKTESSMFRNQIISALATCMPSQEFIDLLIDFLKSSEVEKRRLAASQFANNESPLAISELISALQDPDLEVRSLSITALGLCKDEQAVEPLIACLKEESAEIRQNACQALGSIGSPDIIDPLTTVLNDEALEVRQAAILALGQIGLDYVLDSLLPHLKDPEPAIRSTVVQSLGYINTPQVVDILISTLSDEDETVIYTALQSLEQLGDRRAIEPLENRLLEIGDQNPFLTDSIKLIIDKLKNSISEEQSFTEEYTDNDETIDSPNGDKDKDDGWII